MTVSSETRISGPYTGNGVTTVFPFYFRVFSESDLRVVQLTDAGVESDLTLTTDYTVTLNADQGDNPGGSVTTVSAVPDGYLLTMTSQVDNKQLVELSNGGAFLADVITTALDKLTVQVQQVASETTRAVRTPLSDGDSASLELPAAALRASSLLGFTVTGALTTFPTSTSYTDEGAWETVASAASIDITAETSRNKLITGTTPISSLGAGSDGMTRFLAFQSANSLQPSSNISTLNDATMTLYAGDTVAVTWRGGAWEVVFVQRAYGVAAAGRAAFNVVDFGADPSGVADSTAAFVAARTAAVATGSYSVYIPPGVFKIDNVNAGSVSWHGAGMALTTVKFYTTGANHFGGGTAGASFCGIKFDGQKALTKAAGLGHGSGFPISINASDITMDRCYFYEAPLAAFNQGNTDANRWTVKNCRALNCGSGPSYEYVTLPFVSGADNLMQDCVVISTDFECGAGFGFEINAGNACPILRNRFINNWAIGCGFVGDGSSSANKPDGIIITGGCIDARGYSTATHGYDSGAPFYLREIYRVKISGVMAFGAVNGNYQIATLAGVSYYSIEDCDFYVSPPSGNTAYGYYFKTGGTITKSTDGTIRGNKVTNLTGNAPRYQIYAPTAAATGVKYETPSYRSNWVGVSTSGEVLLPVDADHRQTAFMDTAPSTHRASVTVGAITSGATDYSQTATVACGKGDILTAECITVLPAGVRFSAVIEGTNTVRFYFTNHTGGSVTPGTVSIRLRVQRYSSVSSSSTDI